MRYLKNNGYLPESEVARLSSQIFSAIFYMHLKGITHRDIKLGNILLDHQFNVKIADFGLSNIFEKE